MLVSLAELGGTLTVNAAGAAVERVVDEEVTFQAELTVTCWTGEYLQTQRKRKKKVPFDSETNKAGAQISTLVLYNVAF